MRRAITLLMALVLALTGMTFIVSENAQAEDYGSGLDIVIVIDRSGTMLITDPQRTVLSVVKTLADISSIDNQIGSSVGISIIPYGYSLTDYGYGDDGFRFYNVSDEQELTGLKEKVDKLFYMQDGNDDTNTGLALEKAYEIIEERKALFPNHKFAVLLLSDGEVDVGDSRGFFKKANEKQLSFDKRNQLAANETEESIRRGKEASERMRDAGIKLHCVGVYNGSMDKLGNNMEKWARATGGMYEITKSTPDNEELRELVNEIYLEINPHANCSDTIVIGEEGGYFEIKEGILQANIQVIPSFGDASMVKLYHVGNGTEQPVPLTQSNIRQSSSNNQQNSYTVISLPNPEPGLYKILIDDNKAHNFALIVFSIRDLLMKIDPIDDVQNDDTVRIRLSVTKDGIAYEDANETPKITIKNDDNGMIAVNMRDMDKDPNAPGWYYYDYPTTENGIFTVQAQMRKDGFVNFSNSEKLTVTTYPVQPTADSLHIPPFGGDDYGSGLDIVIVIDRSGTMLNTDPKNTVLSVVKTLADISSIDNQIGNIVGISIIPYGYSLTDYGYGDDGFRFYNVSDEQELTGLKEKVDKLSTIRDGNDDTNTGLALEKAYEIIEERKALFPNHKFAVLLLSDGEVNVGDSRGFANKANSIQLYGEKKETLAEHETLESIYRGKEASERMRDAGIKLHCVGVYNGSMDKLGNNMEKWARATGGLYIITKSTLDNEELRELINEIYLEINPLRLFCS